MIYDNPDDREEMPANRWKELCLNCGYNFFHHNGWACYFKANRPINTILFSKLPPEFRYCTPSMNAIIARSLFCSSNKAWFESSDITDNKPVAMKEDWQLFKNSIEGECACGISRQACAYHKD